MQQAPPISHANRSLPGAGGHEQQLTISYSLQLDGSLITALRIQAQRCVSELSPCRTAHPGQALPSPPPFPPEKGRLKIDVTGSQVPPLQAGSRAQSSLQAARASSSWGLRSRRELSFPWPTSLSPGRQRWKQDAGAEPVPTHFHFPDVMLMIRRLNQAQRVCNAFSHQWESWLRNSFMILTSQFTWHGSTSGCLCTGNSCVLPPPTKGPCTGKILGVSVRCGTLDFDGCRG